MGMLVQYYVKQYNQIVAAEVCSRMFRLYIGLKARQFSQLQTSTA